MDSANAANLAWDLAEVVKTFTRRQKRLTTSALIGAGAYSDAIQQLLKLFIDARVALPIDLSMQAHHWVDGYTGCDNEPALRALVNIAASPDPPETPAQRSSSGRPRAEPRHALAPRPFRDQISPPIVMSTRGWRTPV
ncbi:hypothetical protein [Mycobacterium sp.]|uniref:hypothetical protein n=1 Tax=Mycobacterium sp. TaxID=1785 RepID=UPI002B58EDD1|nr:hypothetical protein [Mycobacterium sp.]HKP42724.1 hypothetical protein [Mycobacterium sp.]